MTMAPWDKIKQELPNVVISTGYGTTEAGPAVFGRHPNGIPTPPLALGYPIALDNVKLVNGSENEGVLLMRNPALMDHYHHLPEQTRRQSSGGAQGEVPSKPAAAFFWGVG
jgi:long-chain acyl-CoA synthetase